MRFPRASTIVLVSLVATVAVVAQADFIKTAAVDFKAILSPPPAQDSDQTKQEIEQILKLQDSRTPEEVARAKSEANYNVWLFSTPLGSWFKADDLPVTGKFLNEILRETGGVTTAAKNFYGRKRPFLIDARVKPCFDVDASFSYPSGHSDAATVEGLVLAKMFPDERDALIARSRQIGDDRVLAGVHFPSDVEAGRTLGAAIFKRMETDASFETQLLNAHDECLAHEAAK
jgi:acid phosphatase (class A)